MKSAWLKTWLAAEHKHLASLSKHVLAERSISGVQKQGPIESVASPQPRRTRPLDLCLNHRGGADSRQSVYSVVRNVSLGADHEAVRHFVIDADMDAANKTIRIDGSDCV